MTKTPYPTYTERENLKFKLYAEDREIIRRLYSQGLSCYVIAKKYGVWWNTIKAIVAPEYRKKRNQHSKTVWPKYRRTGKEVTALNNRFIKRKIKIKTKYAYITWRRKTSRESKWSKNKSAQYSREYYWRNKEKVLARKKVYYLKLKERKNADS